MSSGSASTTGPGRPFSARWKAWLTSSGMRRASSIWVDPLGHLAEHVAVVDLLERLAVGRLARHLPDQQDHGRRILEAGMQSDAGIGRARTARDEGDPGLAGQLAVGLGHVGRAAFLAADDVADRVALGVERVERREIALARNAEDRVGAVDAQLVDQDLRAAAARMWSWSCFSLTSWVRTRSAPISCCSCLHEFSALLQVGLPRGVGGHRGAAPGAVGEIFVAPRYARSRSRCRPRCEK